MLLGLSWHDGSLILLAGLFGAPHCFTMCGGIVTAATLNSSPSHAIIVYNIGRIFSYSLLGAAMGFAGSFVELAGRLSGAQGFASILGGLFMLLWIWKKKQLPYATAMSNQLHRKLSAASAGSRRLAFWHMLSTGFAFGFLPCGLTYAMQMNAAASGSPISGAIIMLLFGLSTFPILAATALGASWITKKNRRWLNKASIWAAIVIGSLAIMRGLAVNGWIPSIAPWLW